MMEIEELEKLFREKKDNRNNLAYTFSEFEKKIIPEIKTLIIETINKKQNIYQLTGCKSLSIANAVTRTFSTKLGKLWEEIAALSPYVISPELELGYKIPEVDVIVKYNNNFYYTQLKTQKNTLTGSQASRTKAELSRYSNSWFVACIDTECKWTAPDGIERLVGREFWDKIGIDYDEILKQLTPLCQAIEMLI